MKSGLFIKPMTALLLALGCLSAMPAMAASYRIIIPVNNQSSSVVTEPEPISDYQLAVSRSSIDFGAVSAPGVASEELLRVTNVGTENVTGVSWPTSVGGAASWGLTGFGVDCEDAEYVPGVGITLFPGGYCDLNLGFRVNDVSGLLEGEVSGIYTITANEVDPMNINVYGRTVISSLEIYLGEEKFITREAGPNVIFTPPGSQVTLYLDNDGTAPLSYSVPTPLLGSLAGDCALGLPLAAQSGCDLVINVPAYDVGESQGTATIFSGSITKDGYMGVGNPHTGGISVAVYRSKYPCSDELDVRKAFPTASAAYCFGGDGLPTMDVFHNGSPVPATVTEQEIAENRHGYIEITAPMSETTISLELQNNGTHTLETESFYLGAWGELLPSSTCVSGGTVSAGGSCTLDIHLLTTSTPAIQEMYIQRNFHTGAGLEIRFNRGG